MGFRWEEDLRQSFISHATPELWCAARKVHYIFSMKESTCSDGRADWVWANVAMRSPGNDSFPNARVLEERACSRILAALRFQPAVKMDVLQLHSGVSQKSFRRHLDSLIDLDFVTRIEEQSFSLGRAFRIPKMEICSFEFKLKNWRRAFQQAKRYRSFSHRVYVVMPSDVAESAVDYFEEFSTFNIGLISHDEDGRSERLVMSRKSEPRSPCHFLRAVGSLLGQLEDQAMSLSNSEIARAQSAR
jgi:hypothetical protein